MGTIKQQKCNFYYNYILCRTNCQDETHLFKHLDAKKPLGSKTKKKKLLSIHGSMDLIVITLTVLICIAIK